MQEIPKESMTVEGMIVLKRKTLYVKRYAKIENFFFSYKKSQSNNFNP